MSMGNLIKKGFYILLIGVATYGWWKVIGYLKKKVNEEG